MKKYGFLLTIIFCCLCKSMGQLKHLQTAVLVVGGTTGGTAAGIQSARSGAKTLIVEQTHWLGGMLTAAGVSCTDGNNDLHSGMWEEFRQALYRHYHTRNLFAGWVSETCFEPHVGDSIFKAWAAKEKNLQVEYGWYFDHALKNGNKVIGAGFVNTKGERLEVNAVITIDATDLGDVFADAGAEYDLGTEDSLQSGEKIAPGKSSVIQDLTWAATLKDYGKAVDKTIPRPPDYDPKKYYCSTIDAPCNSKPYAANTQKVLDYGKLRVPKGMPDKYMLNWPAHGNDNYLNVVEMKPIDREKKYTQSKNQTLGFIYFLQTVLKQKNIGLADDEMDHGMAFVPYNREGRRVKGFVRFNIDHIKTPYRYSLYRTGIAVGDYPVDHHHAQYPGKVPPIPFPQVPSYTIPLGALIPKNMKGLLVCDKGISVSNIANGTTRLQPVVLLTGQAAGMIAAQDLHNDGEFLGTDPHAIQAELLKNKCYIMPFADVAVTDPAWEAIQRIGASGLIEGEGKSIGWANKTFFYPDSLWRNDELQSSIKKIFFWRNRKLPSKLSANKYVTLQDIINEYVIDYGNNTGERSVTKKMADLEKAMAVFHLPKKQLQDFLTRKEIAVYFDYFYGPYFGPVNLEGSYYFTE